MNVCTSSETMAILSSAKNTWTLCTKVVVWVQYPFPRWDIILILVSTTFSRNTTTTSM